MAGLTMDEMNLFIKISSKHQVKIKEIEKRQNTVKYQQKMEREKK